MVIATTDRRLSRTQLLANPNKTIRANNTLLLTRLTFRRTLILISDHTWNKENSPHLLVSSSIMNAYIVQIYITPRFELIFVLFLCANCCKTSQNIKNECKKYKKNFGEKQSYLDKSRRHYLKRTQGTDLLESSNCNFLQEIYSSWTILKTLVWKRKNVLTVICRYARHEC